jgi:uncharacterized membrane protein (UPF0136 family)
MLLLALATARYTAIMDGAPDYRLGRRYRRSCANRSASAGVFAGALIILVGVLMLLDSLGIVAGRDLWMFAPALLIAFGCLKIVESRSRPGGMIFGAIIASAGTVWLLDNLKIIHFDPRMIWPLILIAVGLGMLVRAAGRRRYLDPQLPSPESSSTVLQWAVFGGTRRTINTADFRGGEAFSIFSGIELDFRMSKMSSPAAVFDTTAIFGGIDLKVPQDWMVTVKGVSIFGGFDDKTLHPPTGAPEIIITGYAFFGGVTVSN